MTESGERCSDGRIEAAFRVGRRPADRRGGEGARPGGGRVAAALGGQRTANVRLGPTRPSAGSGRRLAIHSRRSSRHRGLELVAAIADHDAPAAGGHRGQRHSASRVGVTLTRSGTCGPSVLGVDSDRARLTTVSMVCSPTISHTARPIRASGTPARCQHDPPLAAFNRRSPTSRTTWTCPRSGKDPHDTGLTHKDWQSGPRGRAIVHRSPSKANGQRRSLTSIKGGENDWRRFDGCVIGWSDSRKNRGCRHSQSQPIGCSLVAQRKTA